MPGPLTHPDEFTLLRYVTNDLSEVEAAHVLRHVRTCTACAESLAATKVLDATLRDKGEEILAPVPDEEDLPEEDPFRSRPQPSLRKAPDPGDVTTQIMPAHAEAPPITERLLEAIGRPTEDVLRTLDLSHLRDRYALGAALDASTTRMGDGPPAWLRFARAVIDILPAQQPAPSTSTLAEYAYPLADLHGRAHLVAGWAANWTGELDQAGTHLTTAFHAFGLGSASPQDLAMVELHESQRRSFLNRPHEALLLALRAATTFDYLRLEVPAAKARFAEGIALSYLHRDADAVPLFTSALEPLAQAGLWNAYASVLNDLGFSYLELGRYDDARRTYATALQRISRASHPSVHAFVRYNLGFVHFRTGRHEEAARVFADVIHDFEGVGSTADALVTTLYLIEALARSGNLGPARNHLTALKDRLAQEHALDPSALRALTDALAGNVPDLERLARLREEAEPVIRSRFAR